MSDRKRLGMKLINIGFLFLAVFGFASDVWADISDIGLESTVSAIARFHQPERTFEQEGKEVEIQTIERGSGEEKGTHIPEPMVFDLVRPLGAKAGSGR